MPSARRTVGFMAAAGVASFGLHHSYGDYWHETRNANNTITGIDFYTPDDKPVEDEDPVINRTVWASELNDELQGLGQKDPWCASNKMNTAHGEFVQICLDESSLVIHPDRIIAYMRTNPYIEQKEGNPSIFLTYQQEQFVPVCQNNKEEMRAQFRQSLVMLIGDTASRFTIEIHVDSRNPTHPCDDKG